MCKSSKLQQRQAPPSPAEFGSPSCSGFSAALHLSMAQLYIRRGEHQTSFLAYNENEQHLHRAVRMQMSYVFCVEQNHYISADLLMQLYGLKSLRSTLLSIIFKIRIIKPQNYDVQTARHKNSTKIISKFRFQHCQESSKLGLADLRVLTQPFKQTGHHLAWLLNCCQYSSSHLLLFMTTKAD